jgi:hypothetical protein
MLSLSVSFAHGVVRTDVLFYLETSMKPSPFQMSNIYQAYRAGLSPLEAASLLRLVPSTVIAEYVRLDCISQPNQE